MRAQTEKRATRKEGLPLEINGANDIPKLEEPDYSGITSERYVKPSWTKLGITFGLLLQLLYPGIEKS